MMRFTIRDLLWLTVVVALGVAWALDRTTLYRELQACRFAHTIRRLEDAISLPQRKAPAQNPPKK